MWICNTIAFITSLILTGMDSDRELNSRVFLGPDLRVLNSLGCLNPYEIKENYQIWRLFTTLFLSIGFSNYVISSGTLMFIGFMIESSRMNIGTIAVFYFVAGGIASIFSCLVSSNLSCGNFSAIMALLSGLLALVIRNFHALGSAGPLRICLIFFIVIIFVIFLIMTASSESPGQSFSGVDLAGEGGGFMSGLWLGMMIMPAVRRGAERPGSCEKLVQKIGAGIFFFYTILLICLFIWVADPARTVYSM